MGSDEEEVTIGASSSVVCARTGCESACPSDVPAGATAQPACDDVVGACVLKCDVDSEVPVVHHAHGWVACTLDRHLCRCKGDAQLKFGNWPRCILGSLRALFTEHEKLPREDLDSLHASKQSLQCNELMRIRKCFVF